MQIPLAKVRKGFPTAKLLDLFRKKWIAKYSKELLELELTLENGDPVPSMLPQGDLTVIVKRKEHRTGAQARSSAAAFRTLALVEPTTGNDARTWYLKRGILDEVSTRWAMSQVEKYNDGSRRVRDMLVSYELGFALNRKGIYSEARLALAQAATTNFFATESIDPRWARKIFTEWALAEAQGAVDRWQEVAVHKLAVNRNIWRRWDQRPVDVYRPDLHASPLWDLDDDLCLDLFDVPRLRKAYDDTFREGGAQTITLPVDDVEDAGFLVEASAVAENLRTKCSRVRDVRLEVVTSETHRPETRCAATNEFLRYELVLDGNDTSALRVADTVCPQPRDKVFIYDPSFEHELWVETSRVAIICDVTHPGCSDASPPIDGDADNSRLYASV